MSIQPANQTTNSSWHLAHVIRQTIQGMDSVARENALLRIKAELLRDKIPNLEVLKYINALLHGKRPPCCVCHRHTKGGESCQTKP
jgi:hypothetical protein